MERNGTGKIWKAHASWGRVKRVFQKAQDIFSPHGIKNLKNFEKK